MTYENHWLPGFNFNVEERNAEGLHYETMAICCSLELTRAVFVAPSRSSCPFGRAARDVLR
jgi:hypothetical protein